MTTRARVPKRLLGIWAHPDDEVYLSAGLMARVVDAGGEVTVVAATNGENGTSDRLLYGSDSFGALRQRELRASLGELGVTNARFLGVPDGGCDAADDASVVQTLVDIIGSVQPDAIVTFGPDGITGHPDHITVSRWVTEAWRATRPAALHYATMTDDHASEHAELHAALGLFTEFGDGDPVSVARSEISLECVLDDAELTRKRRSLARHRTQTESIAAQIGEDTFRTWWRNETFRSPTPAEARTPRSVMFQGARDITPMVVGLVPFAPAVGSAIAASLLDRGTGLASGPVVLGGTAQLAVIQMLGTRSWVPRRLPLSLVRRCSRRARVHRTRPNDLTAERHDNSVPRATIQLNATAPARVKRQR